MTSAAPQTLHRELGVFGATMLGLGSMVGTGLFVSLGVAAGVAGPAVILAVPVAALVALCNALSSAQLAAAHAVSGGTYEFGYRYLRPWLGFTAGWMFLCAKTASAATAALGFAGYALNLAGRGSDGLRFLAFAAVTLFTFLALGGVRRSNRVNIAIVGVTLTALAIFVIAGVPDLVRNGRENLVPVFSQTGGRGAGAFFYATALMFVAFTGYGRIATMGEEVRNPRYSIPRAVVSALMVSALLYMLVALVALGAVGVDRFAAAARDQATPLGVAAQAIGVPALSTLVAIGAITAMLGVLLNLLLGLSRVALAMGRRGDLPPLFGRLSKGGNGPSAAVVGVGISVGALAVTGSVETTWSFSAFTVLIYYAVTNLAALQLSRRDRLYPRVFAISGLIACLFLAFWVPPRVWLAGLSLMCIGLIWHWFAARLWGRQPNARQTTT